jgi:iron complex outermembrane receptor protein
MPVNHVPASLNLRRRSPLPHYLRLALLALPLLTTLPAQAQSNAAASTATRSYNIPAAPLGQALRQFASEAGILLSADASLMQGKRSPGLHASVSIKEGLQQLLSGSGLVAIVQADGSYILQPLSMATTQSQLPAVNVGDTRSAQADGTYRVAPNVSTLRTDASVLEIPQIVNVVPAQVIADQRPRNLDDALMNVSGITQGNTLASTQDTIMKRGFGGNRDGSVMHDGMPLVQGRGFSATTESVEVLKGPSSLLYGIMDPGGVINIVSKKPLLEQRTSVSALASSYAKGRNGGGGTLDTTGPIGDSGLAYRLIIDRIDENYWRNFGQHQETLVAPSIAWYGKDTQVLFSVEHREFLYPFDRGTAFDPNTKTPLAIPADRRLDEPFNNMEGWSDLVQLKIDHQLNQDWKAHVGLSYNREAYDAEQLRVMSVNPTTGTITRRSDATHGAFSADSYATAYLDGKTTIGGLRNDIQVGADIEYRRIYRADLLRNSSTTSTFSYLNPVYGTVSPSTTISASDSEQTDLLHDQSLFLQDALHLNEKWILVGGMRFQDYSQVAGRGRPFVTNTKLSGNKWLPRAGLVYKWNERLSLYGSFTKSLKPTSTIAPFDTGVVIDSSVAPEQATSWETGAKYDVATGLTATLALFNINKRNVLVSQTDASTGLTNYRTAGAARSRGLEFDVTGQLGERWNVIGSYAYTDAKTTEDPLYQGLRLWNVAKQTASASAVYDFGAIVGGDKLRTGASAHYVGKRAGDSANSFMLPAYTTFDTFATYNTKINGQAVKFQLNLKNIFNRVYYTSSVSTSFVSVGDARQISLLTTLEF